MTTTNERRQFPRVAVGQAARLRPHERIVVQVEVVDCSPQGFRARCDAVLAVGGLVSLDVPGIGSVEARIIWRGDGEFGARFVRPVDLGHCAWTNPAVAEGLVADEDSEPAVQLARALAERAARKVPPSAPMEILAQEE